MSQARWCDSCGRTFSELDVRARRMQIEEKVKEGARFVVQVIERDACGDCMDKLNGVATAPALEAAPQTPEAAKAA